MRLLVIRTSAMGDVALTVPVLSAMRKQYPDIEIVLLTRPAFKPFFSSVDGLRYFFPDLNNKHKGISGLIRLYRDLSRMAKFDHVIDLHDVLRSKILRLLFRISCIPGSVIDKGRDEKKSVINGNNKVLLKHVVKRYCDVFARAGFPLIPSGEVLSIPLQDPLLKAGFTTDSKDLLNIGVAPYAKHKLKIWPEEYMIALLGLIAKEHKCRFWLFGGDEDSKKISVFQTRVPGSENLVGLLDLEEELALMGKLDMMIAMDSSNMHMAALTGTKVISIWGGTDPLTGFGAWMQPENFSVRIPVEELTCRPCTIYGKGECRRGDLACMNWLTPEIVFVKMNSLKIW
jgi:ADP-heptose:LPS heptosyltransferase